MIIVFNGNILDLVNDLRQFSGKDEKTTLDFMFENFKIMKHQSKEITLAIYNDEQNKADADNQT